MMEDQKLAWDFSRQRAEAELHLRREMEALGLHQARGWRIKEFTRDTPEGTEWVLQPMHFWLTAPEGLECVIKLRLQDASVRTSCMPRDLHTG